MKIRMLVALAASMSLLPATAFALPDPWADNVVGYVPGTDVPSGYTNPAAALGAPSRIDDPTSPWAADVTPINPAYGTGQVVSLGKGGQLTLSFNEPVANDPGNPFGIDLIVFGNSFCRWDFANNVATGGVAGEGGTIEIGNGGTAWTAVTEPADGGFPTAGWIDWRAEWGQFGTQPADFTRPVDPAFSFTAGLTAAQVSAAYNGSGGGTGIDIGKYGLEQITHVRISNPENSATTPEIDAVADVHAVPEPGTLALLLTCAVALRRRSRGEKP